MNDIEHSKLYVDGLDGLDGYLLGPTLRAPYGANKHGYKEGGCGLHLVALPGYCTCTHVMIDPM